MKSNSKTGKLKGDFEASTIEVFEKRYSILNQTHCLKKEPKFIDFVLIHPEVPSNGTLSKMLESQIKFREAFENSLASQGFDIQKITHDKLVYTTLHCPFKRLCVEAEKVKLEMPLKNMVIKKPPGDFFQQFLNRYLETDHEVTKYICAPFFMNNINFYENYEDPGAFFRPSVRSFLVYHILINTDLRTKDEIAEELSDTSPLLALKFQYFESSKIPGCLERKGLNYLLMKKVYTDFFLLHEESELDRKYDIIKHRGSIYLSEKYDEKKDIRLKLSEEWTQLYKFQPLWKIRCYFGEKIAFYFAWTGMLITTLWVPMLFGLIIFIYGYLRTDEKDDFLLSFKKAFDNNATPIFALFMCCWGTVFLEIWKRHTSRLAFEWSVESFETDEPNRPQYFGTQVKKDPVTEQDVWYYPASLRIVKFCASTGVLLTMISMVFASALGVIVYRTIVTIDFCPNLSQAGCFLFTTVFSNILTAISIHILSKVYNNIAVILTDWENYRTQTDYNNALIIKLFAFRFVNSYTPCFYNAFLREAIWLHSEHYNDSCYGSCMAQLSFQVMVLIVSNSLPKFFNDIGFTLLRHFWHGMKSRIKRSPKDYNEVKVNEADANIFLLERERLKRNAGDLTIDEFTEKVILYGYLMIFAASFPLAPLFAMILCFLDIRLDASRLLRFFRRPVAQLSQNIGIWFTILNFLNIVGVSNNAFLIAFTSSWGQQFNLTGKLIVVIVFEHLVFALKFILASLIPDVPFDIQIAKQKKKYVLQKRHEIEFSNIDYKRLFAASGSDTNQVYASKEMINQDLNKVNGKESMSSKKLNKLNDKKPSTDIDNISVNVNQMRQKEK